MAKGIVATVAGTVSVREFGEPLYKTVGEAVGGYIEPVRAIWLPDPYMVLVNEEGFLENLKPNYLGSLLCVGLIVGDIVIMKTAETEDGPDIVGLEDEDIAALKKIFPRYAGLKWEEETA